MKSRIELAICFGTLLVPILLNVLTADEPGLLPNARREIYKKVGTTELALHIFQPPEHEPSDRRAAAIFFFGGGWNGGTVRQFAPHCEYLASRGMIGIVADYRVASRHGTTPFECVKDGRSAIRWVRMHAARLGIDPQRIAAGGGSAGGHVAAATDTLSNINEVGEATKVSAKPNALLLFNPVYDNGPDGYGHDRVGDRFREISPFHNIREGMSPTIVFLGTNDRLIPVKTAKAFQEKMAKVGSRSELFLYDGQAHGFFNHSRFRPGRSPLYFNQTVFEMDRFLISLGFLTDEPTIEAPQFDLQLNEGQILDVSYGGRKIGRYMFAYDASSQEKRHETYKPYLHIFGKNGERPITKGPGGKFTHHRGIFLGYNRMLFQGERYDLWHMKNCVQVHQKFLEKRSNYRSASLTSLVHWQKDDGTVMLQEERTLTFHLPPEPCYAMIDMDSKLTAVAGDVALSGDPEHAGAQFRPANEIFAAETKYVFPTADTDPKKHVDIRWAAETFRIPSGVHSVIFLNHLQNPRGTRFSAYRDYGRFGAYPEFTLRSKESRRLRYRWMITDGDLPPSDAIEANWRNYTSN